MAAISVSRRAISGIVLIVAGALFLLHAVLPLLGVTLPVFFFLAEIAIAIAYLILGLGAVNNTVAKISLVAAAIGWLLLVLTLVLPLPGVLITIAWVVAGVGGLLGAVVILVGREVANTSALVFVIATALGLLALLATFGVLALGSLATAVLALFGVALIATGLLFRMKERRGRR